MPAPILRYRTISKLPRRQIPNPDNAVAFRNRCPDVPVFDDYRTLLSSTEVDVVSICTPGPTHTGIMIDVLNTTKVHSVWLEKPAAMTAEESQNVRQRLLRGDVSVFVSHVRRWSPIWQETLQRLDGGEIGAIHHIIVKLPNRLWSIGSHAVDLALFLGKSLQMPQCIALKQLDQDGEPAVAVCGTSDHGAMLSVLPTGMKEQLIVEVEAIGSNGRLIADEAGGTISVQRFQHAANYAGYSSLSQPLVSVAATLADQSPFVAIARDIANRTTPLCSYDDAVRCLELLELMANAAGRSREAYQ